MIMKKILAKLLIAIFVIGAFSGIEVDAASRNRKALRAYASYLENGSYSEFALADINGDGVKEWFAINVGKRMQ